ncbi:MAG: acyl-CoA dehydratase activase [Syntrophorhabdaceae bacterium]
MLVAGCDLGSATGKVVIMRDGIIVSSVVVRSTMIPEKTGMLALEKALEKIGLHSLADLEYILGTGYGRRSVSFIKENLSEITCHARGAHWLHPRTRTVVDLGGQDCKVISVDDRGKVIEFAMNDKCAAGTGKFFEVMARTFDCSLDEFAELALQSNAPANITKQCSVFAESEVVTLIYSGVDQADIAAGLVDSIVRRVVAMIHKVGYVPDLILTGGCAKNEALIRSIEKAIGQGIARLPDPQIVGAIGAALFAQDRVDKQARDSQRQEGNGSDSDPDAFQASDTVTEG